MAVFHADDFGVAQVEPGFLREMAYAHFGADQHRHDEAVAGGIHRAAERFHVARMHHRAAHRRNAFAQRQQLTEARFRIEQTDFRRADVLEPQLLGRCQHPGGAVQHTVAPLVHHLAVQFDPLLFLVLADDGGGHRQRVADAHRLGEVQRLVEVDGARPRELGAEQGGNERTAPHAVRDHAVEQRVLRVLRIEVGRIGVSGHGGEGLDVSQGQRAQQTGALADLQLIEGDVLYPLGGGRVVLCGIHAGPGQARCSIRRRRGSRHRRRWSGRSCRTRRPSTGRCSAARSLPASPGDPAAPCGWRCPSVRRRRRYRTRRGS